MKCKHKPKNKELGYVACHMWDEKQIKSGEKQKQCPVCKLWFFPCEF